MTTTIVYVACADSHEIAVLRLDAGSGALTPVQQVPVGSTVMPLTVSPDRRRLYASIRSAPFTVLSFAIDPAEGTLLPLGTGSLPASMCWIGFDRTGRWLLSTSYGDSLVAASPIGDDGVAGPARHTVSTAPNAHSIQTDPANRFAFAACLGGDVIQAFDFDAGSGALELRPEPAWRTRAGAGPRHFASSGGTVRLSAQRARRHRRCARVPRRCRPFRPRPDDRRRATGHRRQALGGRYPLHAGRPIPLHQRAPLEHARGLRRRSRGRLADAARPQCDRGAAARLRDRPVRPLAARRRAGVASPARPCDRRRDRCARRPCRARGRHEPQLVEIVALG